MATPPDEISTLLSHAQGLAGMAAADVLRRAARIQREVDPVAAAHTLEKALAGLSDGPAEPRRVAALELELGAIYERDLSRLEEAITHYQRSFKADLSATEAIEAGRRIYQTLGDQVMVARLYQVELDVTAAPRRRSDLLLELGRWMMTEVRDLPSAAAALEEAAKLRPEDEAARELLASVYSHADFPPVGDGTAAPRRAVELLLDLAERKRRKHDDEGHLDLLRRALGVDPSGRDAALALELAYQRNGDRPSLAQLYRTATAIPHRALKRSKMAEEAGQRDEALAACREALADPEEGPEAQATLERLLGAAEDFSSLAELREAMLGDLSGPERCDALVELAALYVKAGKAAIAVERLEEALTIDPLHAGALAAAEKELAARKELSRLARLHEGAAAAASDEDRPARLAALAELYEKRIGDANAAAEAWGRAEALLPSEKGASELRRLGAKIDSSDRHLGLLAKELERATDDEAKVDVWRRTAQVYRERHEVETAAELYETVLELKPGDALVMRALSDLWEREGDWQRVVDVYRRQLELPLQKVERLNLLRRLAVVSDERLAEAELTVWACREVLRELPGDRDSLKRMAAVCERAGDQEGQLAALETHAQAAATPTEKGPLLVRIASLLEKRGDPAAAAERLEKAIKLMPADAAATESLARCLEAAERWPDLSMLLERGLAKADAVGWRRFARVVDGKLGDRMRAEKAWKEVAARLPNDREALDGLIALSRQRNDPGGLAELLRRREAIADDPEEAFTVGVERATLLERKLNDAPGAIAALERLLAEVAPRNLDLHSALRRLYLERGDVRRAVAIAERELFLSDPDERLDLALAIAELWRDRGGDRPRAIEAFDRALSLAPDHKEALAALAALLAAEGRWERLIEVQERRLELVSDGETLDALELLASIAEVCERHLADPARAFSYRKLAWELLPEDRTFAELSRVATDHQLWDELVAVHRSIGGLPSLRTIAALYEQRVRDPRRALEVLMEAVTPDGLDPLGEELLVEIERLAKLARAPQALLEVYEVLIETHGDPSVRLDLIGRRARVREGAGDPSGAMVDRLRQYSLAPDDPAVLIELRRLAAVTGRWEDLLTVEGDRFRRAEGIDKLGVAREAAELVETRLGDRVRAFRAWLSAFALAPGDGEVLAELWRLARAIGRISDGPAPRKPPTEEIQLDLEDSGIFFEPDLDVKSSKPERRDSTMPLGMSDLLEVLEKRPPAAPPPTPDTAPTAKATRPPPVPQGGSHLAWDELERAYLYLPAPTVDEKVGYLLDVARMWEEGAGDVDRAFEVLGRAYRVDPDRTPARDALDLLAAAHERWDDLVQILDAVAEETGSSERTLRLLLETAELRERTGNLPDAEARYQRVLGMRPDLEDALSRLEELYRSTNRHAELVILLERRATGLMERMPPGPERRAKLEELARTYEAMGSPYEAIDAWARLLSEDDEHLEALRAHVRLYERVGQWSRVIDALTKIANHAAPDESRGARRRKAEILERELELPERAMEAYLDVDDEEARAALERLYVKHHRPRELEQLLKRRSLSSTGSELEVLLQRRASLLTESLDDFEAAAAAYRELSAMRPDDDAVAASLEAVLERSGQHAEQAAVLKRRIDAADRRGAAGRARADLLIKLGALLAGPLDDAPSAQKILQRALALVPDDPSAIAELARLREGGSDWLGYAAARVREAEVAPDDAHAARALVDAARVQSEKLADDGAARWCLQKALEREPGNDAALALLAALHRRQHDDAAADALVERRLALLAPDDKARAPLSSELGASAARRGDGGAATAHHRAALAIDESHLAAVYGLAELEGNAGRWEEVEALLTDVAKRPELAPSAAAEVWRRVAEARERVGRSEEAYAALLESDRFAHGGVATKLLLGENRFRAGRWREAAQHLTTVAEHADAAALGRDAAEALCHGAIAEVKQRRPERADALYRRALEIAPDFIPALTALTEAAIDAGDLSAAADLLERRAEATGDPQERAALFEALAELVLSDLSDPLRARLALRRATEAAGPSVSEALLSRRLELAREANDVEEAAALSEQLLERASTPEARSIRLRDAASLASAVGRGGAARERLTEALSIDPRDEEALAGLSGMLVAAGEDEAAAQLLTRSLALLAPPVPERRLARAVLWRRLGEARDRLRDGKGAAAAFEHALTDNPSLRELREILIARYSDGGGDDAARPHLAILIADDPLHAPSLRALAAIEARSGGEKRARRLTELLAVSGAATADELKSLRQPARHQASDEAYRGALDEEDHPLLAHSDARMLGEVLAVLWEGTGAQAPGIDVHGLRPEDRTSPVSDLDVAKAFGACARALGNRRTGLFIKPDPALNSALVVAQPPTAIIVGPQLAEGRATPSLRFILGRALETARPEYVLAAALPPADFARLLSTVLRAFHPRHARRSDTPDDVAQLKRKLPYKVAQRLAEMLRAHPDTEFSSARWRRAVQFTGHRAGLLLCGDSVAASSVLKAEGDEEAVRELARFAASELCAQLTAKLDGLTPSSEPT